MAVAAIKVNDMLELELSDEAGVVAGSAVVTVDEKFRCTSEGVCLEATYLGASVPGLGLWFMGLPNPLHIHLCQGSTRKCGFDIQGRTIVHCEKWRMRWMRDVNEQWLISKLPDHPDYDGGDFADRSDTDGDQSPGGTWEPPASRAVPPVGLRPSNVGSRSRKERKKDSDAVVEVEENARSSGPLGVAAPLTDGIMSKVRDQGNDLVTGGGRQRLSSLRPLGARGKWPPDGPPPVLDLSDVDKPLPPPDFPPPAPEVPARGLERGARGAALQEKPGDEDPSRKWLSPGEVLVMRAADAAKYREDQKQKSRKTGHGHHRGRGSRHRHHRRHDRRGSSRSSSSSKSSRSETSVFRKAFQQGGDLNKIQLQAEKHPGALLQSGLSTMRGFTDPGAQLLEGETAHTQIQAGVVKYLHTVLHHLRKQHLDEEGERELQTLARSLDLLSKGSLPQLGDTLMQRFKALEMKARTGDTKIARHVELIPAESISAMGQRESEIATSCESRALKLEELARRHRL